MFIGYLVQKTNSKVPEHDDLMITTTIIVLWQDNIKDLSWQLVVVEQKLSLVALPTWEEEREGACFAFLIIYYFEEQLKRVLNFKW